MKGRNSIFSSSSVHNGHRTEKCGDGAPEAADLYFSYGKALLENAISQTAVLGKEEAEEAILKDQVEEAGKPAFVAFTFALCGSNALVGSSSKDLKPFISFSGDAEDDDELAPEGEDPAVDLFGQAEAAAASEEQDDEEQEGEEGEEGEPEDDFNAAWEVLDLARAIYEKRKDEDDEVKLKLADTYIALGDVSLETGTYCLMPSVMHLTLLTCTCRKVRSGYFRLYGSCETQDRPPSSLFSPNCRSTLQT